MERTLFAKRLYSLGDYKNIEFSNAITGIPEEIATNPQVINLLYRDMYLSMEIAYRSYYAMIENLTKEKVADVIGTLKAEQARSFAELSEQMDKASDTTKKFAEVIKEYTEEETN